MLTGSHLVKRFPAFYGTRRFIIVFTPAPILSLIPVTMDRSLPEAMYPFRNKASFYGEELLASCPDPKMENHPLSIVRDCLFNIFIVTFHVPPSATWPRAMPWWQGPTYRGLDAKVQNLISSQPGAQGFSTLQ